MKRRNKYGAVRTTCIHGHKHDSKREAARCAELHLLARDGQIADLEVHPQYWFVIAGVQVKHPNGRRVGMKPDFRYTENGREVAEDVKSKATASESAFVLRATLFRHLFPTIELRLTT